MSLDAVRQFFVKYGIERTSVVAAVSGGYDSTALLITLAELRSEGLSLFAAHVNHHLRGEESDEDQGFVQDLCRRLDVQLFVTDGRIASDLMKQRGLEGAAREMRYARLAAIRESSGARFVATAHQKNDQAETVLMRIITGTGLAGLRGVHPMRSDGFVRPMLEVTREEIQRFLAERGITPRVDRSNLDPRFLRNRVRQVLASIGGVNSIAAIARQAQSLWPLVEQAVDVAEAAACEVSPTETRFRSWPEDIWLRQALLHRHIRRLDPHSRDVAAHDVERLVQQLPSIKRTTVTKSLELVRAASELVLRLVLQPVAEFEIDVTPGIASFIPQVNVTVHVVPRAHGPLAAPPTDRSRQLIQLPDGAEPHFTIRNRRDGDRFHPLGLSSVKKLKDFLIDRKIAAELRDGLPLIIFNGEIAWIGGVEVSERFKVTDRPGQVYEVWLEKTADHEQ